MYCFFFSCIPYWYIVGYFWAIRCDLKIIALLKYLQLCYINFFSANGIKETNNITIWKGIAKAWIIYAWKRKFCMFSINYSANITLWWSDEIKIMLDLMLDENISHVSDVKSKNGTLVGPQGRSLVRVIRKFEDLFSQIEHLA